MIAIYGWLTLTFVSFGALTYTMDNPTWIPGIPAEMHAAVWLMFIIMALTGIFMTLDAEIGEGDDPMVKRAKRAFKKAKQRPLRSRRR